MRMSKDLRTRRFRVSWFLCLLQCSLPHRRSSSCYHWFCSFCWFLNTIRANTDERNPVFANQMKAPGTSAATNSRRFRGSDIAERSRALRVASLRQNGLPSPEPCGQRAPTGDDRHGDEARTANRQAKRMQPAISPGTDLIAHAVSESVDDAFRF